MRQASRNGGGNLQTRTLRLWCGALNVALRRPPRICSPPFRWLVNGTEIPLGMDSRYTLVAGSLVISSPQSARDTGSYQCLAINRCGTIISRAANIKFGCECEQGANCGGDKS